MKKTFIRIICVTAILLPLGAQAEELIKEFKGSRSTNPLEFEVRDPWILDWRISGDADIALHGYPPGWYSDWHTIQEGSHK